MKVFRKFIKAAAFVLAFVVLFGAVSGVLVCPNDYRNYQWVGAFYENEKNSLDAVYLGSSTVYAFWSPAIAWEQNGIAVWNYTSPRQPLVAAKYIIEDCRKTQKDALYIVNLNRVAMKYDKTAMHYLLDYMPFSINKLLLTEKLCKTAGIEGEDKVQYFFPLQLYHTRWSSLTSKDFSYKPDGTMGSPQYGGFLTGVFEDEQEEVVLTDEESEPKQKYIDILNDLLDYCEKNEVKVLFTVNPQIAEDAQRQSEINFAKELVTERGFSVADFYTDFSSLGLDSTQDFYNKEHTNIHGAVKMTALFSDYLIKNYNLEDKRGKAGYEDWDKAAEKYKKIIASSVVPIELDTVNRDYTIADVQFTESIFDGEKVCLQWEGSEKAEGYKVYRKTTGDKKSKQSDFSEVASLGAESLSFEDTDIEKENGEITYNYVVVPFRTENGVQKWGSFRYKGVSVTVK